MISPPSCGVNSGTASGRTIGYYQGANVRSRACNKIYPHQINITGYTHLYFAFASIDPSTFQIVPASSDDIALYSEFTALKSSKLQTWIAVGGFDFSDKGPTRHTWSILCSDAKLRQQFITSVISFLDTYGFQGIDLDWEYPGDADRGGVPEDTQNFVLLVKELSQAFAGKV
jgi:chitinase